MPRKLILVVFFSLLAPAQLFAHAYLVKSVPAGRAVLFRAPARIQLWFNERLEPRYSSLTLSDANGERVDLGNAEVGSDDPKRLSVEIKPLLPGRYTVRFRVLSVDGHVVQDEFPFTIK